MVDGTYELLIEDRRGTAVLETTGNALTATVKLPGLPSQKGTGTVEGNAFKAAGSVRIPIMGKFEYELAGTVQDDLLEATCKTTRGTFQVAGIRTVS